jgi:hypothetical protein
LAGRPVIGAWIALAALIVIEIVLGVLIVRETR